LATKPDPAAKFFECTDRERAAFEAGIKLGAIYHQYVGAAVDARSVASLERAIEASTRSQPHVASVRVAIARAALRPRGPYREVSLTAEMLDVTVEIRFGRARAHGRLANVADLGYPLMSVAVSGA